jgi:hypothetical protein
MGLWNQLTGKEDADKANKKAREAQQQNYEKIRREEYQSAVTASQLTNALLMSDIGDNMAGRGLTDTIRADYESKIASQTKNAEITNYYIELNKKFNNKYANQAIQQWQQVSSPEEIDRIEGILGISN